MSSAKNIKYLISFLSVLFIYGKTIAQWTQTNGPEGGNISAIESIDSRLIIAANYGGLFKSDDGVTWAPANKGFDGIPRINNLYTSGNTFFAFGGDNGIYQSTDLGESWKPVNDLFANQNIISILIQDSKIFIGTYQTLYFSSDSGETWKERDAPASNQLNHLTVFDDKLYAAGSNVYESENDGQDWTEIEIADLTGGQIKDLHTFQDQLYIADYGSVFYSTDPSGSWSIYDLPESNANQFVASGDSLFITSSQGQLYYTKDDGTTWLSVQNEDFDEDFNHFVWDAVIDKDLILAASNEGLFVSTDQGLSWEEQKDGLRKLDITQILKTDQYLYAGTDGDGLYVSEDDGNTWVRISEGWDELNDDNITGINVIGNNLIVSTSSAIYQSTDEGESWEQRLLAGTNLSINGIGFYDKKVIAVIGTDGAYVSSDTTKTWERVSDLSSSVYRMEVADGLCIAVNFYDVMISEDMGNTWETVLTNDAFTFDVSYHDGKIYIGDRDGVKVSEDKGDSWQSISDGLTSTYHTDLLFVEDKMYLGTLNGVYQSAIEDPYWSAVNEGIEDNPINKLEYKDGTVYAGTNNASVWKVTIDDLNEIEIALGLEELDQKILSYFPNPATDLLNIKLKNFVHTNGKIRLANIHGQELLTQSYNQVHNIRLDISQLPKGVYILSVVTEDKVISEKIIIK